MNIPVDSPCAVPDVCLNCSAYFFGLCRALKAAQLDKLNYITRQKKLPRGSIITLDEDNVSSFANIISGMVKLTKNLSDGRQQIVGLQFAPDFIGRPYESKARITAEAASDVELCILPRETIETILQTNPEFENLMLRQTLVQLDYARDWMVTLGRKTADEKVASFLTLLDRHMGQDTVTGARSFTLPLRRHEMADFLGLTIETVSRQLSRLRKAGLIEIKNNHDFILTNPAKIHSMAEN